MAIKKADMVQALKTAGIELSGSETVAQLQELMTEHNVTLADDTNETVATVYSSTSQVIREYTRDIHGKDFQALAEEFSAHTPGSTVQVR